MTPRAGLAFSTTIAAAAALACAATADAEITVRYSAVPGAGLAITGGTGESDHVRVELVCERETCVYQVVQHLAVIAHVAGGCALTGVEPATVQCPVTGTTRVRARMGAEDDALVVDRCDRAIVVDADMGAGNDLYAGCRGAGAVSRDDVRGGSGLDTLRGNDGDDHLDGGPGADALDGGAGADRLDARDGVPDRLGCGGDHPLGHGPGGVLAAWTHEPTDRAELDRADPVPVDCEAADIASPGRRTGTLITALGVARPRRGLIAVRLACRISRCTGRVVATVARLHAAPDRRPRPLSTTFTLQRSVVLTAPVSLPLGDRRALARQRRVVLVRVTAFSPARDGWTSSSLLVPVRGGPGRG